MPTPIDSVPVWLKYISTPSTRNPYRGDALRTFGLTKDLNNHRQDVLGSHDHGMDSGRDIFGILPESRPEGGRPGWWWCVI